MVGKQVHGNRQTEPPHLPQIERGDTDQAAPRIEQRPAPEAGIDGGRLDRRFQAVLPVRVERSQIRDDPVTHSALGGAGTAEDEDLLPPPERARVRQGRGRTLVSGQTQHCQPGLEILRRDFDLAAVPGGEGGLDRPRAHDDDGIHRDNQLFREGF